MTTSADKPSNVAETSRTDEHSQRDATSLRLLGVFFLALGLIVLIGSFWELGRPRALLVNIIAGGVLELVGGGMLVAARRLSTPTRAR